MHVTIHDSRVNSQQFELLPWCSSAQFRSVSGQFRTASAQFRQVVNSDRSATDGKRSKSFGKRSKFIFPDRQALKIVWQVKIYFFRPQNRAAKAQNLFFPIGKRSKSFGKRSKFIFSDRQALKIIRNFIFSDR